MQQPCLKHFKRHHRFDVFEPHHFLFKHTQRHLIYRRQLILVSYPLFSRYITFLSGNKFRFFVTSSGSGSLYPDLPFPCVLVTKGKCGCNSTCRTLELEVLAASTCEEKLCSIRWYWEILYGTNVWILQRWAASSSTLHHGVPQVASWTGFIKRSFLTLAVSPDLLGKSGSSGIASSDQAQDTATTEEKSEPVKGVETPNDEKGEDGLSKICFWICTDASNTNFPIRRPGAQPFFQGQGHSIRYMKTYGQDLFLVCARDFWLQQANKNEQ